MNRVIISLTREGDHRTYDLELPADIASSQLCHFLRTALRWSATVTTEGLTLHIGGPSGRGLQPAETLVEAKIWDGAHLIIKGAVNPHSQSIDSASPTDEQGPVKGWQPIFPSDLPLRLSSIPNPSMERETINKVTPTGDSLLNSSTEDLGSITPSDSIDSSTTSIDRGGPVIGWIQD